MEFNLLKLIADFECISGDEILLLSKALRDRYSLEDLDYLKLSKLLEELISRGYIEYSKEGCVRLTNKGLILIKDIVSRRG